MVTGSELHRIEAAADDLQPETVEFLQSMIRTPSENPPGDYTAITDVVETTYREHGWDTEIVRASDELLERLDLPHPRPNVLGYATRGDGPTIALNAHLDTVPAEPEKWTRDPFGGGVEDGFVWGRGAKDSKGRIAAYTYALRILEECDLLPPDATVVLAMTADEETGGEAGAGFVVESGALVPDYAIVEGNMYSIQYASSGVLHLEVTVSGKAAHAGLRAHQGANALLGAVPILEALDAYHRRLSEEESEVPGVGSPTCVPTMMECGVKTNVVPPVCTVRVDRRVPPDYDVHEAEAEFHDVIDGVELPPGISVDVDVVRKAHSFLDDPNGLHVQAFKRNVDAVLDRNPVEIAGCDGEVPLGGTRGFSDARFFAQGGARTVKFGPGDHDSGSHGPDEHLSIAQLRNTGAIVAASIVDIVREHSS